MNNRFPILSVISIIFKFLGWAAVAIGLYLAIYWGIIEPNSPGHSFGAENRISLISGILSVFGGLVAAAFGEAIGVLFAIEENTRKM